MLRIQIFISAVFVLISIKTFAQNCTSERYLSNIFQSAVSQDVVFGNSPALTAVYVAENVTVNQAMTMDIFFPVGDALEKRPLVILAYGGGYLFGTKNDEDVWATCDSLAKKGYVTASINYRMNMNVASNTSAVRAIYRAAQDYSSAIRYLKEFSGTYQIDTNYVFVGGVSAGGFSAMHAVFLDDNERPAATFQSGIFGTDPDLGCMNCAGNGYQHTTNVRGIINLWGALMDTSYIQPNEVVPITLFHGTDDLIVPYAFGFPFTALFLMPEVFGSFNIAARINHLGGNAELNTFSTGHNIWGLNVNNVMVGGPTEYWNPITDSIISFLYENIRPAQPELSLTEPACQSDTVFIQIVNFPADGRGCWSIELGDVVWTSADSSSIGVVWNNQGVYDVEAVVFNHLEAFSFPTTTEVEVYPLPVVSITNNIGVLEASGNYSNYQWYVDGQLLPGENQSQLIPTSFGEYTVEAINAQGCSMLSEPLLAVRIQEQSQMMTEIAAIKVFDAMGKLIVEFESLDEFTFQKWSASQMVFIHYFDTEQNLIGTEKKLTTAF
ncbi:MAG: alpha/beta hydrolase [Flavobacteriales bacterium]|nr:alpha/beta hydrolase [Flavobacteriales bacterium]